MDNDMDNGQVSGCPVYVANVFSAYVVYGLNCATVSNLNNVLGNSFSETEIVEAKDLLWDVTCLEDKPRRNRSSNRPVKEMHTHNIIDGVLKLRQMKKMPCFVVKPEDFPRLPSFNAETVNTETMDSRIRSLESSLVEMDTMMKINTNNILEHTSRLNGMRMADVISKCATPTSPLRSHVDHLAHPVQVPSAPPLDDLDDSVNVISSDVRDNNNVLMENGSVANKLTEGVVMDTTRAPDIKTNGISGET